MALSTTMDIKVMLTLCTLFFFAPYFLLTKKHGTEVRKMTAELNITVEQLNTALKVSQQNQKQIDEYAKEIETLKKELAGNKQTP